ncbi:hypothetical protein Lalb_Chr15g0081121 [Lupinus albus]|uniref:Uncharacterized protein n=1 Tax=Lupinus albus TaxID=3870 RepID=A0A6A4P8T1_LUPAL|nr:hypothetical protein Lalb_Chr15g0081121 [Lupinus albus]
MSFDQIKVMNLDFLIGFLWFQRIQLQENRKRRAPPPPFFLPNSLVSMVGPRPSGCRRPPWGDLIVPMGWRRRGRSMDFLSFCRYKGFVNL